MSQDNQTLIAETPQASRRGLLLGLMAAAAVPAVPAIAKAMPAAVPAVPVAPIAAAVAGPEEPFEWDMHYPDAKLFKLVNEYLAADEERRRLEGVIDRAQKVQEAKYPMPDVLRVRSEDAELELPDHNGVYDGLFFDRSSRKDYHDAMWIDHLRRPQWKRLAEYTPPNLEPVCHYEGFDPSPAARARADEIVAAYDDWWPKLHRRAAREIKTRLPRGYRAVEKQEERLSRLLGRLEAKINKTRARTFPGLLAKAKIASLVVPEGDYDPALDAIQRDMLAMGQDLAWPGCHGKSLYLVENDEALS
jgi:hypothetical protein